MKRTSGFIRSASTAMPKNNKKCSLVIAKQKVNRKKNHYFTALHEIRNVQTLIEIEGQTCFSAFAGLRVFDLNMSLASWPSLRVPSPLAGAGGCSLPKTAFTIVNLVNFEWQSLPRVPNFCVLAHGCLPINCDKPRGEAL